ncbi:MAG TPA: peptidoglycan DD-metalloendopeptidase family protein [Bacteroidales bacterium]|nr:peptidoglycan DD-metalloendopeptidase family protein [Bacteroidales bacterium]
MRRFLNIVFSVLLLMFLGNGDLFAQSEKEKLRKNKEKIEQEIRLTNNLLQETKKNKKASINQLVLLEKKIDQRQRLIDNIESEIYYLNNSILYNQKRISELEKKLEKLRGEYARMIQAAQKNQNNMTRLMYLFASEDFNQAIKRMQYFRQYGHYRREQSLLIQNTQDSIKNKNQELRDMRQRKVSLKAQQEFEKQNMVEEKTEKNKTINNLASEEKQLLADLRRKKKESDRLNKAIEKAIAEEIVKAEAAANKSTEDKPTIKRTFELTPDQVKLSNSFADNRGKLPWPTEKGIISSTFGEHPHPVLKYVKTQNNGIDILTVKGQKARAVFSGTVTNVVGMSNTKKAIIIRHGEYLSVYSNIKEVLVSVGQQVDTKQVIGEIYTEGNSNKTELHFEIWKGKKLQNPSYWLAD